MSGYEPGVCNIGRPQRRRRRRVALAAFAVAAVYVALCVAGAVSTALVVGVFVPLAVGFEYAFQAHAGFCVRLALADAYDFRGDGTAGSDAGANEVGEGPADERGAVTDPVARRDDRLRAARITAAALVAALTATALVAAGVDALAA